MLFHLVALAVVLSILAHSSTDVPIARYFAPQRQRRLGHQQVTLEGEDPAVPSFVGLRAGERTHRDPPR